MPNKKTILFYFTQIEMNVLSIFLAPSFEEIKLGCNGYSPFLPLLSHKFMVQLFSQLLIFFSRTYEKDNIIHEQLL
jgi:hypothetical protein